MNHPELFEDSILETIHVSASNSDANVTQTEKHTADPVILPSNYRSISAAAADIFSRFRVQQKLFRHAGRVVELSESNSTTTLSIIKPAALCSRLDSLGSVVEEKKDPKTGELLLVPRVCNESRAKLLLETTEARTLLSEITLVAPSPILVRDGKVIKMLDKGWHPQRGGVLVTGTINRIYPPLDIAHSMLLDLLRDYKFATKADEARAMATLLAPALRFGGVIDDLTPLLLIAADTQSAGKSFLCDLVATLYGVEFSNVTQRVGGVGSFDESIDDALVSGFPLIVLDNLKEVVDSARLESIITSQFPVACRVPYVGNVKVNTKGMLFLGTTNSAFLSPDLASRSLVVEIVKQPSNYTFTDYGHRDLLAHIRDLRDGYLSAVYAIVEAWAAKGFPVDRSSRHRMGVWAMNTGGILSMLGYANFCAGNNGSQIFRSEPLIEWLVQLAQNSTATKIEETTTGLVRVGMESGIPAPTKQGETPEAFARRCGRTVSKLIRLGETIEVGNVHIQRGDRHNPTSRKQETYYTLTRTSPADPI